MGLATLALASGALLIGLASGRLPLFAQTTPVAPIDTEAKPGIAVSGHDPVAYFSEAKPVEGKANITASYRGAEWRFASEANRRAFLAEPERYAPQFGGYCSWAVAGGYTAPADPEAWRIVDGKLYLNYSKEVQARWEQDIPGHIARGEQNWPKIIAGK